MSQTSDIMELREEDIRAHYAAALTLLEGFDHAPRIAKARDAGGAERSPGIGTRRRFRSTTPGLVTRRRVPAGAVQLAARIEDVTEDELITPLESTALNAVRRAIAMAQALSDTVSETIGLGDLKRANFEGSLPQARVTELEEMLGAEALYTLYNFANALAYLLSPHLPEVAVETGEIEEILTSNAQTALHGVLWELDGLIETHAGTMPILWRRWPRLQRR